jgi:hypothetical protein
MIEAGLKPRDAASASQKPAETAPATTGRV